MKNKIVLFTSSQCPKCPTVKQVLDTLEYSYTVVSVDDNFGLSTTLGIRSVPTIKIMRDSVVLDEDYKEQEGDVIDTIVGLSTSLKYRLETASQ